MLQLELDTRGGYFCVNNPASGLGLKFSLQKLSLVSPMKLATFMGEIMFLNEEDEILVGALVKCIRASGESRKDWERRIAEIPRSFSDRGLIIEAVKIVFRNEGTA